METWTISTGKTELASWSFLLRVGRADTNGITTFPQICSAFQLRKTVNSVSSANSLARSEAVIILSVHSRSLKYLLQKVLILRTERMEFSLTSGNGLSCQTWACQAPKWTGYVETWVCQALQWIGCVRTWACQAQQWTGCVEGISPHSFLRPVPQRLTPIELNSGRCHCHIGPRMGTLFFVWLCVFCFGFGRVSLSTSGHLPTRDPHPPKTGTSGIYHRTWLFAKFLPRGLHCLLIWQLKPLAWERVPCFPKPIQSAPASRCVS